MSGEQQLTSAAIESVAQLSRKSMEPRVIEASSEPRGLYDVWNPSTGAIERRRAGLKAMDLQLDSLQDLARWVAAGDKAVAAEESPSAPCIYYGPTPAVGVRMKGGFREWARCVLTLSEEYERLGEIRGKELPPRAFWTALRTYFGKAVSPDTVAFFGKLRFTASGVTGMELRVGKEAYSRDVQAEIVGDNAVPESLVMNLRVFAIPDMKGLRYPVTVCLDTNPEARTIALLPASDALEDALDLALEDVATKLVEAAAGLGVGVVRGLPSERT